jgi:4-amino-4-deoxy-L-arabinose transferase-like glycosyltransferase
MQKVLLVLIFIIVLLIPRLVNLDADAVAIEALHNQDEGNYNANVRNLIVSHQWFRDQTNFVLLTPLFAAMQVPFVWLFGVHLWSFRLLNVVMSLLTLGVGYFFLKKEVSRRAAIYWLVIIGFNFLYLVHTRIAMPEVTQAFFIFTALLAAHYAFIKNNWWLFFIAGLLATGAFLTKSSGVIVYGILAGLGIYHFLFRPKPDLKSVGLGMLMIAFGAVFPIIIWQVFIVAPNQSLYSIVYVNLIEQNRPRLFGGVLTYSYWREVIPAFLNGGEAQVWRYLTIMLVFLGVSIYDVAANLRRAQNIRVLSLCLMWLTVGLIYFLIVGYKPARYLVHLIIPLAMVSSILLARYSGRFAQLGLAVYLLIEMFWINTYIFSNVHFSLREISHKLEQTVAVERIAGDPLLHLGDGTSQLYNYYFLDTPYSHSRFDEYLQSLGYPEYVIFNPAVHQPRIDKAEQIGYTLYQDMEINSYFPQPTRLSLYKYAEK